MESIIPSGKEQRKITITDNSYHQIVPAVTVIVDAGWSTHSHKYSNNAKSRVAIIIGKATGKILHMGYAIKFAQFVINVPRHHFPYLLLELEWFFCCHGN